MSIELTEIELVPMKGSILLYIVIVLGRREMTRVEHVQLKLSSITSLGALSALTAHFKTARYARHKET